MVKNTTGGNKAKAKSRKGRERGGGELKGVEPDDIRTFRGIMLRGAGDFRIEVEIPTLGDKFICRIPGKFRKRNYFNPGDHVLILSSEMIDRVHRGDILEVMAHLSRPREKKKVEEGGEGFEFDDGGEGEGDDDAPKVRSGATRALPPMDDESEEGF